MGKALSPTTYGTLKRDRATRAITVRRSAHQVRFLQPLGWSYYATLRRKLHWNAGVA